LSEKSAALLLPPLPNTESTLTSLHSTLLHNGMAIVGGPYRESGLTNMADVSGGTPYGATTLAGPDGSRQPSENELKIARSQGKHMAEIAAGSSANSPAAKQK
jgi:NAD(P)H dehydrogenase (quinone)